MFSTDLPLALAMNNKIIVAYLSHKRNYTIKWYWCLVQVDSAHPCSIVMAQFSNVFRIKWYTFQSIVFLLPNFWRVRTWKFNLQKYLFQNIHHRYYLLCQFEMKNSEIKCKHFSYWKWFSEKTNNSNISSIKIVTVQIIQWCTFFGIGALKNEISSK